MSDLENANIQVSWEDQQKINTFGRLNVRLHELEDEITQLKEDLSKISDVNDEIYITDDIKMLLGESFVNVDKDGAESFLAEAQSTVNNDLSAKQTELATIQARMKQLKAQLYAKFGKAINLDEQQ